MGASSIIRVDDPSAVGEARRLAASFAEDLGFDETMRGKASIAVTEIGTNVCRHGGGGLIILRAVDDATGCFLETIALDKGRGIPNVDAALRDGFSTGGSAGEGLGAIARLSREFDVWSAPDQGTAVLSRIGRVTPLPCTIGVVSIAAPGEAVCGDGFFIEPDGARVRLSVIDGLGHGKGAAHATWEALGALRRASGRSLVDVMDEVHGALRPTRGAAVGIGDLDFITRRVEWLGVGNIAATIVDDQGKTHSAVSHNGIVGHTVRRTSSFRYDWPVAGLLIVYSDGITTSWRLAAYRGLDQRHPALIAGVLYRDHVRGRDDATVMVVRDAPVRGTS